MRRVGILFLLLGALGLSGAIIGVGDLIGAIQHDEHTISGQTTQLHHQTHEIGNLEAALATNVKNQLANREANVYTWCNAINADRNYQRKRVRTFAKANPMQFVTPYTLTDLPCTNLATATANSAITPTTVPK